MELTLLLWLSIALILAATLYASVGHGGASGYMAVMVLFGLQPEVMRPAALCMNIVVTSWILFQHRRFFHRLWPYVPLLLPAIPAAFIGGAWQLESKTYQLIVGTALLAAGIRILIPSTPLRPAQPANKSCLITLGLLLGLLAGVTGIGGGVFLSPILVMMGWCSIHASIVPVATLIWFNSLAGLGGFLYSNGQIPDNTFLLAILALIGGIAGAQISLRLHGHWALSCLLGLVLLIAATKMLYLGFI